MNCYGTKEKIEKVSKGAFGKRRVNSNTDNDLIQCYKGEVQILAERKINLHKVPLL